MKNLGQEVKHIAYLHSKTISSSKMVRQNNDFREEKCSLKDKEIIESKICSHW